MGACVGYEEYFKLKWIPLTFSSFFKEKKQYEEKETLRKQICFVFLQREGTEVPILAVLQRSTFLLPCSQFLPRGWPTWLVHRVG